MKRIIVSAAAVAVLTGVASLAVTMFSCFAATARGQAAQPSSVPHKVGLIDMAEVFKKYKKFDALRDDLKIDITRSQQEDQKQMSRITKLQKQIKLLKPDAPDYAKFEKELLGATSELQAYRNGVKRNLLKKESQIYKTIYLEVTDVVQQAAEAYHYTLIIRFNRQSLEEADDPRKVIQTMNQLVVDYREEDDITDSVLDYLNKRYSAANKTPSKTSSPTRTSRTPSSGGTRPR